MYPDITININFNFPAIVAGSGAAQVAEDTSANGPPPQEVASEGSGAATMQTAPPPDEFLMKTWPVFPRVTWAANHRVLKRRTPHR